MADWYARKQVGDRHEQRVMHELRKRGWTVHQCGQGTYPAAIQNALIRTNSTLRHFPDMIAARDGEVVTIDAKERMHSIDTGRYAISRKCLTAGLQFLGMHPHSPLLRLW